MTFARLVCGAVGGLLFLASPAAAADETATDVPLQVSGTYQVSGTITPIGSNQHSPVGGTIILFQRGDEYDSAYNLGMRILTKDGLMPADVVGRGSGRIEGRRLIGRTETQLMLQKSPGAEDSPRLPRDYSPVTTSDTTVIVEDDGDLIIELEGEPLAEGAPRNRVELRGVRVHVPDVASPPRD